MGTWGLKFVFIFFINWLNFFFFSGWPCCLLDLSSLTRDRTWTSAVKTPSLKHWIAREFPLSAFCCIWRNKSDFKTKVLVLIISDNSTWIFSGLCGTVRVKHEPVFQTLQLLGGKSKMEFRMCSDWRLFFLCESYFAYISNFSLKKWPRLW